MIKKEVTPVPFSKPAKPKKARGIQFMTNERSAYEYAEQQSAMCDALAQATAHEIEYRGMRVLLRYSAAMTPTEIAAFADESERIRAQYPCSFIDERDGKNWDANVQRAHRVALANWYGTFSGTLQKIAMAAIKVKGTYCSGGVKITYEVNGTVKSGHWDTSSGNGALNLEITITAIEGLAPHLRPVRVRGLIMGDDLLVWVYFDKMVDPQEYARAMNGRESAAGIHPVRGVFKDILNVSFCSMGFYWTVDGTLAVVPKLGRMFAKLFWTVTPLAGRNPARLASTIAHAMYPIYKDFKPMRVFLKRHMRVAPIELAVLDTVPYVMRHEFNPRWPLILWKECNHVKYGLFDDSLDEFTELMRTDFMGGVYHPVIDLMLEQDLSDPPERLGVLSA